MRRNSVIYLILPILLATSGCSNDEPLNGAGTSTLLEAAESGNLNQVNDLLQQQSANIRDACQWTPLMKAALYGHTEVARELLEAGAQVELQDKGGYTALMLAASNNHHELVSLLIQHGADINRVETTKGWSPLIWAAKRGHIETVEVLLEAGCRPELQDFDGKSALDWAREKSHQAVISRLTNGVG
ncbi:MAG: ankyrin repeat domain-containing protein [Chromatiales bacterium]|nr:ankyrin repeat domain-containing protein [Chromatiales bacterium]